jgi:antitoxin component YwqK of YwqJK toxin-antitoxin module
LRSPRLGRTLRFVTANPAPTATDVSPPDALLEGAVFDPAQDGWVRCQLDDSGRRHGPYRVYRRDGTLAFQGDYDAGLPVGPVVEFYPSGAVRSEGQYRDGKLDGVFVHYASDEPGAKPLRSCCVPPGAREMRLYYDAGSVRMERFFDASGRALRSNGKPLPELPRSLPPYVDFDETSQRWVQRERLADARTLVRTFDLLGQLVEEAETSHGQRESSRVFADGALVEEKRFDAQGRLHGAYRRTYPKESSYADARIREERGQFQEGHPVGGWTFHGSDGDVLRHVDRGTLPTQERLAELAKEPLGELVQALPRVERCVAEGSVREALWLAARLHHRSKDQSPLLALLPQFVVLPAERQQAAWRRLLESQRPLDVLQALDALLSGASPAEVLRVLAASAPEGSVAALDLIEGALAFEPRHLRALSNRGMLRLERGDLTGALEDAQSLEMLGEASAAELMRATATALFSPFVFEPAAALPVARDDELPVVEIDQPLEAIRRTIALYATRIVRTRKVLATWASLEEPWMPPDLTRLLPDGQVELRTVRLTIEDETEDGVEQSEVLVDESAGLDGSTLQRLLWTARADWGSLCWLCWACGLDEVTLPSTLHPPPLLPAAIDEAMARCWQLHDAPAHRGFGREVAQCSRLRVGRLCRVEAPSLTAALCR